MFKATLLGFHFLTTVLLSGYKGETIVAHNLEEISKTVFQDIELIIVKEDFTGPAKLIIDWPKYSKVEVEEVYSSEASFSYDGDKSLYIWYSIPEDNVINLTYRIKGQLSDLKDLKGYFSYIQDGEVVKKPVSLHDFSVLK